MESLNTIADGILKRHITNCEKCEILQPRSQGNWKPCEFHRGFVAGIIAMVNQINVELESVGFDGK